jgi:hypothetical protein
VNLPFPEDHSNPETFKDEPVFIFTDKAILPPPKEKGPVNPPSSGEEETPNPPSADEPG